jgi:hypothetical protein
VDWCNVDEEADKDCSKGIGADEDVEVDAEEETSSTSTACNSA